MPLFSTSWIASLNDLILVEHFVGLGGEQRLMGVAHA